VRHKFSVPPAVKLAAAEAFSLAGLQSLASRIYDGK
jgi:hypothetical protein